MDIKKVKVGMRVMWNDPDNADPECNCSGPGTVVSIQGEDLEEGPYDDAVIVLDMDDGGGPEVLACELTPMRSKKKKR